ncbi:MAG TPA: ribosome biogenesis GTPase Der [Chloroflexota bacterium]|nr:ribosome biogenesis GTPase Der [Chloroflexota bacterium]
MVKPLVALVGRPNVGKSTLFNRIVGERVAIIEDVAGTTRDRLYYDADWTGHDFTIVDTGGLEIQPGSDLATRVRDQAEVAIAEADVILYVVDVRQGVTPGDADVASVLRKSEKPLIVVANKADTVKQEFDAAEFYRLGLTPIFAVSALHGMGTGDLLDAVVERFASVPPSEPAEAKAGVRVALVGRPNVGKSSLLNAIVGFERAIVTEIPGTTRDVVDTRLEIDGKQMTLLDTAGMRRRGQIEPGVERYSVLRTVRAIERADVVAVIMDAPEGVTAQDTHLAGFARDAAKGLILVVNKWDLVPRTAQVREQWTLQAREDMKFVPFAPLVFVSAKQRWNVGEVVSTVFKIADERQKRVPTATLNELLAEAVHVHGPGATRGRTFKIYYVTQASVNPPTFVFFVNDANLIHFAYRRYLENRLREAFGFEGTAIRLVFRTRVGQRAGQRA